MTTLDFYFDFSINQIQLEMFEILSYKEGMKVGESDMKTLHIFWTIICTCINTQNQKLKYYLVETKSE